MKSKLTKVTAPIDGVCRLFGAFAACCTLAPSQAALGANSTLYSHGEPTNLEQYQLELVNAARAKPSDEASRLGIDLNKELSPGRISSAPKQPLAFHPKLLEVARGHSDWMLATENFSHTGLNGSTPSQRAEAKGYNFSVGENIAYLSTSGTPNLNSYTINTHENLFKSPSHRPNLMDPSFSVVGLGLREGEFQGLNALMVTQNFSSGGDSIDSGPFLVGVVYNDLNKNGTYDPGEGLPGVRVEPNFGGYHAVTSQSGGYAVPLPPVETREENVSIPLAVNSTNWADVRTHDEAFRELKISEAPEMELGITWSGGAITQAVQSVVKIRKPTRINYKLVGTNNYNFQSTMVSSLNVKGDYNLANPPPPPGVISPSITTQPSNLSVVAGASATFSISAKGTSLNYQWKKNGIAISGATGSTYAIPNAQTSDAGSYTVNVSNAAGGVNSNAATLTVSPPPPSITSDLSTVSIPKGKLMPRFTITTNFGAKSFAAKGLPRGLKLTSTSGVISGKPTKTGTYTITLTARKMKGKKVEQQATATKVFVVY